MRFTRNIDLTSACRIWLVGIVAALCLVSVQPANAAVKKSLHHKTFVVRDDRGGQVVERLREIRTLRRSGQDVRITGSFCYSTCTMLIGLKTTCVSAETVFGFHGPSRSGRRLSADRFESASRIIAAHYPPFIRSWYLKTARYTIDDIHRIKGSDLIALGVRAC